MSPIFLPSPNNQSSPWIDPQLSVAKWMNDFDVQSQNWTSPNLDFIWYSELEEKNESMHAVPCPIALIYVSWLFSPPPCQNNTLNLKSRSPGVVSPFFCQCLTVTPPASISGLSKTSQVLTSASCHLLGDNFTRTGPQIIWKAAINGW